MIYGSVILSNTTIEMLTNLISLGEVTYFNYGVDLSLAGKVKVDPAADTQYIFNPATVTWRIHFLSTTEINSLTSHPTFIESNDRFDLEGYSWVFMPVLPEDINPLIIIPTIPE